MESQTQRKATWTSFSNHIRDEIRSDIDKKVPKQVERHQLRERRSSPCSRWAWVKTICASRPSARNWSVWSKQHRHMSVTSRTKKQMAKAHAQEEELHEKLSAWSQASLCSKQRIKR